MPAQSANGAASRPPAGRPGIVIRAGFGSLHKVAKSFQADLRSRLRRWLSKVSCGARRNGRA